MALFPGHPPMFWPGTHNASRLFPWAFAIVFALLPMTGHATVIAGTFSGTVNQVSDPSNVIGNDAVIGDAVTGTFSYDTSQITTFNTAPLAGSTLGLKVSVYINWITLQTISTNIGKINVDNTSYMYFTDSYGISNDIYLIFTNTSTFQISFPQDFSFSSNSQSYGNISVAGPNQSIAYEQFLISAASASPVSDVNELWPAPILLVVALALLAGGRRSMRA